MLLLSHFVKEEYLPNLLYFLTVVVSPVVDICAVRTDVSLVALALCYLPCIKFKISLLMYLAHMHRCHEPDLFTRVGSIYIADIYIIDIYPIFSFENIGYFLYFQFLSSF